MLQSTKSLLAALAALAVAHVSAHGSILSPKPVFLDPYNLNAPATTAAGPAGPYTGNAVIKDLAEASGSKCGKTDANAPVKPIPADGMVQLGITAAHIGPCEIWLDNEKVASAKNCVTEYADRKIKVDFSKCKSGKCQLRWVWLATHNSPWEIYDNCVNVGVGGSGPVSPTVTPTVSPKTKKSKTPKPSNTPTKTRAPKPKPTTRKPGSVKSPVVAPDFDDSNGFPVSPDNGNDLPVSPDFPDNNDDFPVSPDFPDNNDDFPVTPDFPDDNNDFPVAPDFPDDNNDFPVAPDFPDNSDDNNNNDNDDLPVSPDFPDDNNNDNNDNVFPDPNNGAGKFRGIDGSEALNWWCQNNCERGYCPEHVCVQV